MSFIRVKMGMVEYSFEYETLEDIINHFKENDCSYIELTTFDNYDSWHSKKTIPIYKLSWDDVKWVQEPCEWGIRYLRGWWN
jgi:hypothetical protein